jgi:signal transduction histidine kinase
MAQDEIGRLVLVLNDTFDRLERSFAQATRFSSDASHELKTPLTIMRGEIESALRTGSYDAETQNLLDSLLGQTQRLSTIADNLLLLSRADARALTLKREAVDLTAMCHGLVEDAEILGMQRNIVTNAEISPEVIVWADKSYVRQALLMFFHLFRRRFSLHGNNPPVSRVNLHFCNVFGTRCGNIE